MTTAIPELSRPQKPGLERSPEPLRGASHGTPAPGEGYALTLAHHELSKRSFENNHHHHDVEVGIGLVAAKRASLVGRGPILSDVTVALSIFGMASGVISAASSEPFAGLAHSYAAQRRFVDAVRIDQLVPGDVAS